VYSAPGGPIVVGEMVYNEPVQIQDRSLLGDWVFVGNPGFNHRRE
jgi:hypothetical protein